jgi:transposase
LTWALELVVWDNNQWGKVVWSDECSIELGSGQAMPYVFCLRGSEHLDTDYYEKKPHGTRVMIWAAFHGTTKSEAIYLPGDPNFPRKGVTSEIYLTCLKEHLPPLMEGKGKIFMMDSASVHTASIVNDWLNEKGYTIIEWPPYSPDLDPIENLWFPTKKGVYPLTDTIEELSREDNKKRLLAAEASAAFQQIFIVKLDKVIKSMKRRCESVIKARGGHTKY